MKYINILHRKGTAMKKNNNVTKIDEAKANQKQDTKVDAKAALNEKLKNIELTEDELRQLKMMQQNHKWAALSTLLGQLPMVIATVTAAFVGLEAAKTNYNASVNGTQK